MNGRGRVCMSVCGRVRTCEGIQRRVEACMDIFSFLVVSECKCAAVRVCGCGRGCEGVHMGGTLGSALFCMILCDFV